MPQNIPSGQLQYSRLITSLVDDEAIGRGIVTSKNVTPVLHFFIEAGLNPQVRNWLMPNGETLKESRWLQIVGWLVGEIVMLEYKKSRVADYLHSRHEFICAYTDPLSIKNCMCRPLPPDIQALLVPLLNRHFSIDF